MTICRSIASLIHVASLFKKMSEKTKCHRWCFTKANSVSNFSCVKSIILLTVQYKLFKEYKCLKTNQTLPRQVNSKNSTPSLTKMEYSRVGCCLAPASTKEEEKHPLISRHSHHIATLIVRYYHDKVAHQR